MDQPMHRKITAVVFLGLAFVSGYMFHVQYFRWRDCFNDQGRCFDAETGVVYFEQSGLVWLSIAVVAFGLSLFQIWRFVRLRR